MCLNNTCKRRLTCYRFTAEPNVPQQAYTTFTEIDGHCLDYWPQRHFPDADPIETLRWIDVRRRSGDLGKISELAELNNGLVSMYITKAGKAVLKPRIVEKIILSFKQILDERK